MSNHPASAFLPDDDPRLDSPPRDDLYPAEVTFRNKEEKRAWDHYFCTLARAPWVDRSGTNGGPDPHLAWLAQMADGMLLARRKREAASGETSK